MIVLCMKWGTRYGADYANRLARAVHRYAPDCRVICFTDNATGIDAAVEALPLPPFVNVPSNIAFTPWRKLSLWQSKLGTLCGAPDIDGELALFLDLDVVVTGDVRKLIETPAEHDFVVWKSPTRKRAVAGNTSVFRFRIGAEPEVFEHFMANPIAAASALSNEQEYISAHLGDGTTIAQIALSPEARSDPFYAGQNRMSFFEPGQVLSFKHDLLPPWPQRLWEAPRAPDNAVIVAFHGKPDPDEARDGLWPAPVYKKFYKTVRPTPWIAHFWQ
jgi:hypothetical protein